MKPIAIVTGVVASGAVLAGLAFIPADVPYRRPASSISVPDGKCHEDDPCFVLCWVEPNPEMVEGVELYRGPQGLQPARSVTVPCPGPGWRGEPIASAK